MVVAIGDVGDGREGLLLLLLLMMMCGSGRKGVGLTLLAVGEMVHGGLVEPE